MKTEKQIQTKIKIKTRESMTRYSGFLAKSDAFADFSSSAILFGLVYIAGALNFVFKRRKSIFNSMEFVKGACLTFHMFIFY